MAVPPGNVGWFPYAPSYSRFTGDYLFELDGLWYRAKDVTVTMPSDKSIGTLSNHHAVIGSNHPDIELPFPPLPATPAQPLEPLTPGATQGAAASASGLATTGGADLTLTGWVGAAVLLAGLGLLIGRRAVRARRG